MSKKDRDTKAETEKQDEAPEEDQKESPPNWIFEIPGLHASVRLTESQRWVSSVTREGNKELHVDSAGWTRSHATRDEAFLRAFTLLAEQMHWRVHNRYAPYGPALAEPLEEGEGIEREPDEETPEATLSGAVAMVGDMLEQTGADRVCFYIGDYEIQIRSTEDD